MIKCIRDKLITSKTTTTNEAILFKSPFRDEKL